jgi:cytochrome oxidase Cu insertion factor (SCO1/SenC/PrrC family)
MGQISCDNETVGLPDLTLTDQCGYQLSLAVLKGKPVLLDFMYTSCAGPCQLLTQQKLIARQVGSLPGAVRVGYDRS